MAEEFEVGDRVVWAGAWRMRSVGPYLATAPEMQEDWQLEVLAAEPVPPKERAEAGHDQYVIVSSAGKCIEVFPGRAARFSGAWFKKLA